MAGKDNKATGQQQQQEQPAAPAAPAAPQAPTTETVEGASIFDKAKADRKHAFDVSKLKVKQELSKQLFSIAHSKELVIKCVSEMYQQKLPNAGRGKAEETDTTLVDIIDMSSGETGALICNSLIVNGFKRAGGDLVGRVFAIREAGIREGKKYRQIDMIELSE